MPASAGFHPDQMRSAFTRRTSSLGIEAPGHGLVNAGCYPFLTDLFNGFSSGRSFSPEVDFLPAAVAEQRNGVEHQVAATNQRDR